jgi:MFS superfamily sulfate permease-like transporter
VCGRILIFGLEGEMFFGSSTDLERHLESVEERIGPETKVVVIRVKRVRSPDAVGEHVFLEQAVRQTSTQAAMRLARKLAGRADVEAAGTLD